MRQREFEAESAVGGCSDWPLADGASVQADQAVGLACGRVRLFGVEVHEQITIQLKVSPVPFAALALAAAHLPEVATQGRCSVVSHGCPAAYTASHET
eukprot:6190181-Pleurochrysis_carterae.AAC.2